MIRIVQSLEHQVLCGYIALVFSTEFNCFPAVYVVARMFVLVYKLVEGFIVMLFTKQHFVGININKVRPFLVGKTESVYLVIDDYLVTFFLAIFIYVNC